VLTVEEMSAVIAPTPTRSRLFTSARWGRQDARSAGMALEVGQPSLKRALAGSRRPQLPVPP
jgi:hypothetical protein